MADARDEMRASDADRTAAGEILRAALDEGRLDFHEYDERLRDAYQAKTYGELNKLMADLPATPPPPAREQQLVPRQQAQPATVLAQASGGHTGRWLAMMWREYALVVGICTTIWFAGVLGSGHLYYFWPIWVAGPWGFFLLFQSAGGLRRGEPQRWADRRARKVERRERKRARRRARFEAEGH
jgi:hypothetical protein